MFVMWGEEVLDPWHQHIQSSRSSSISMIQVQFERAEKEVGSIHTLLRKSTELRYSHRRDKLMRTPLKMS